MPATVHYLQPHWNATYNKSNYQLIVTEDSAEVSEELCNTLIAHCVERLTDAGFGPLLAVEGVTFEIDGVAHSLVDDPDDLTFHVTLHMPQGGQIGVNGILIDKGEVCLDHGMFVEC